jgi:hypothetical protein
VAGSQPSGPDRPADALRERDESHRTDRGLVVGEYDCHSEQDDGR